MSGAWSSGSSALVPACGIPSPSSFAGYSPLTLSLPGDDPKQTQESLYTKDAAQWATVKGSRPGAIDYRWIPGTKVIGAMSFETLETDRPVDQVAFGGDPTIYGSGGAEHGMGTTSVAVGNVNGACAECLLVFIQYTSMESAERALTWAMQQPWIDAISNSYGFSALIAARDRIYNDTDVVTERAASERGQTVFFSAGNGVENAFTVPNSTRLSSQEGPDWVVTVGAVSPTGNDLTGTGKPADIAGIGYGYPSAYDSTTVSDGADFSGTSNATPQIAGTYAKALYFARQALPGASARNQSTSPSGRGAARTSPLRTPHRRCRNSSGKPFSATAPKYAPCPSLANRVSATAAGASTTPTGPSSKCLSSDGRRGTAGCAAHSP